MNRFATRSTLATLLVVAAVACGESGGAGGSSGDEGSGGTPATKAPASTTDAAPAESAAADAAGTEPPESEASGPGTYLVWTVDDDGEQNTSWILGTDDGHVALAAKRGIFIPAKAGLWRYAEKAVEVAGASCATGEADAAPTTPPRKSRIVVPQLARVGGEARQTLVGAGSSEPQSSLTARTIRILGSAGALVFVEYDSTYQPCTSAESSKRGFVLWNAERGEAVDAEALTKAVGAAPGDRARSTIESAVRGRGEACTSATVESALLALLPRFSGARFELTALFGAAVDEACQDPEPRSWSERFATSKVAVTSLPSMLESVGEAPAAVRSFVAADSERRVGGWSAVTGSREEQAAQLSAFQRAPSAPETVEMQEESTEGASRAAAERVCASVEHGRPSCQNIVYAIYQDDIERFLQAAPESGSVRFFGRAVGGRPDMAGALRARGGLHGILPSLTEGGSLVAFDEGNQVDRTLQITMDHSGQTTTFTFAFAERQWRLQSIEQAPS